MQQSVQITSEIHQATEKEIEVDRSNCDAEHLRTRHLCKLSVNTSEHLRSDGLHYTHGDYAQD